VSYEDIKVKKEGRVATITIDRPKVLNATRHETILRSIGHWMILRLMRTYG